MEINLYHYTCDRELVNKTDSLSLAMTLQGTLRQSTSIINPTIIIDIHPQSTQVDNSKVYVDDDARKKVVEKQDNQYVVIYDSIVSSNYVYIPDFKRYYYIADIVAINSYLFELSLNVDVLMSYKDEIRKQRVFIERNEKQFNQLLEDTRLEFQENEDVTEYVPDNVGTGITTFSDGNMESVSIVGVSRGNWWKDEGGEKVDYIDTSYAESVGSSMIVGNQIPTYDEELSGVQSGKVPFLIKRIDLQKFMRAIDSTNASFIDSLTIYPFTIDYDSRAETISTIGLMYIGDKYLTPSIQGYPLKSSIFKPITIARFRFPNANTFTDYTGYTKYEIYIPYYSYVELDYNLLRGNLIEINYAIDYTELSAQVYVVDATHQRVLFTAPVQLGYKIPITADNKYQIGLERAINGINTAFSLVNGTIGGVGGIASGNVVRGASSALGGVTGVATGVLKGKMLHPSANTSQGSSLLSLYLPQKVHLRVTRKIPINYNTDDYKHRQGVPLHEYRTLSSVSGYTECGQLHLTSLGTATSQEIELIENALTGGVIL